MRILDKICDIYNFSSDDKRDFINIVLPIIFHDEYQRRLDSEQFPHHDTISVGEHMLTVAALTYKMCKKRNMPNESISIATQIAVFHDLYEYPWQNTHIEKQMIRNWHAFTHPLEACVNACTWYPKYFSDDKANQIIDGIVHHMFPSPVRALDNLDAELNNNEKFLSLDINLRKMIIVSSNRLVFAHLSFATSSYDTGKIVCYADKKISFSKDMNLKGLSAIITGDNDNLSNYKRKK